MCKKYTDSYEGNLNSAVISLNYNYSFYLCLNILNQKQHRKTGRCKNLCTPF